MKRHLPAFLLAALHVACASSPEESSAAGASAHTEGEVVAPFGPFHWANIAEADLSGSPERTVASDDALVVRLQAWADRIHGLVTEEARARGVGHVPAVPQIHVVRSRAFNAWNRGTLVATGASFEGQRGFTFLSDGELVPVEATDLFGITTRPRDWPSTHGLVEAWRERRPGCDIAELPNHKLTSSACPASARGNVVLSAATPHIYLTSELIARADEKTILVVLAHELGHYYRAHSSSLSWNRFGFWYEGTDASHHPLRTPRAEAFAARYLSVTQAPQPVPSVSVRYHARMVPLVALLALQLAAEPAAKACSPRVQGAAVSSWLTGFMIAGAHAHSEADVDELRRYEADLDACAGTLAVGFPDARTINRSGVEWFLTNGGFASSSDELRSVTTLAEALAFAGERSLRMDRDEQSMLDELRGGDLGFYTAEQDADDVALELVSKLGLSPADTEEAWLQFLVAAEASTGRAGGGSTGTASAEECRLLHESGFTQIVDGKRQLVAMTLGDLHDPHHGGCYRLFNSWMENRAHRYVAQGTFAPPAGPSWSSLREHAITLTPAEKP